jgi:LPS sulfotransferase NodH
MQAAHLVKATQRAAKNIQHVGEELQDRHPTWQVTLRFAGAAGVEALDSRECVRLHAQPGTYLHRPCEVIPRVDRQTVARAVAQLEDEGTREWDDTSATRVY